MNKHGILNRGIKENFAELLEDVNIVRQASRTFKSTKDFDMLVYRGIKEKYEIEFVQRLKSTFKAGHMIIRADQFGSQQVPNWIDAIIYRLLAAHKISTRETQRLIEHIELRGFSNFPQLDIKQSLVALNAIQHKKNRKATILILHAYPQAFRSQTYYLLINAEKRRLCS